MCLIDFFITLIYGICMIYIHFFCRFSDNKIPLHFILFELEYLLCMRIFYNLI